MKISPVTRKIGKIGAGIATVAAPAYYTTKLHMDFYTPQQKERKKKIRNKMIGFWAGYTAAAIIAHKALKTGLSTIAIAMPVACLLPYLGVKAEKYIGFVIDKNERTSNTISLSYS